MGAAAPAPRATGGRNPGGGNHRASVFRRHVGTAVIRWEHLPAGLLDSWAGSRPVAEWARAEDQLEQEVSFQIGAMPFLWLAVPTRPDGSSSRSYIERNSIALLSCATGSPDTPAPGWLGHHASSQNVRRSGLWNSQPLSWPVSKLENGRQVPSARDIRDWARVTGSEGEAQALLTSLHTLEVQHAEWQSQLRGGLRPHQQELAEIDARTRTFRVFDPATIPGVLQTAEYARARFAEGALLFGTPDDIDYAVRARMQRQDLLYRRDKQFHFVITEAALRYRRSALDVHIAQLDRLMSLSALPNVRLGIIGFGTRFTVGPWHAFWLRDQRRVTVETFSAELNISQPREIELYTRVFGQMAAIAGYRREARALITRAADDLAAELPDDGAELPGASNGP